MKKYRLLLPFTIFSLFLFITLYLFAERNTNRENANVYLSEHTIFEDIYFSFQDDYLQKINLYKPEDADTYHAYIPADSTKPLRLYFSHCKSILFNETELSSGDLLPSVSLEVPCHIQAINFDGEIFADDYITFYYSGTIPSVYITTESGNMEQIHADQEYKESASYAVYTTEGSLDSAGACSLKGRGNTSWSVDQKPYNLNLASSTPILGMTQASDWALLSNFGDDFPQLKNKLVFELAEEIDLPYTPQSEFVHLYLNGQYNGLYLLAQRVKVNDGTVKISDGYLLEFDARYEDEPSHFATSHQKVAIKSPEQASPEQIEYIADYLCNIENAIYSDDGINPSTNQSFLNDIDTDSWAKIYMLQNYFVQWDVEFSSFYMYKRKDDPLLYAGPVWDFDLSCGKMYLGDYPKLSQHLLWIQDTQSTWLRRLSTHEEFSNYATQKYLSEISPSIKNLLEVEYNNIISPLVSAVNMDSARWNKGDNSLLDKAGSLHYWLTKRMEFLDAYYQNPDNYYSVAFEFAWSTVPYYIEKNTALDFLPYDAYGEQEKHASLYGFEKIIGWMDENGNEVSAEDIIIKNMIYYPIYQYAE